MRERIRQRAEPCDDDPAYEREIVELVEGVHKRGLANLRVTLEIGRIFDILRRHRIAARSQMTMVNLALNTAEGLGRRLEPELSLTDEALALPRRSPWGGAAAECGLWAAQASAQAPRGTTRRRLEGTSGREG